MTNKVQEYYSKLASSYDENRFGNTYGKYIHKQEELFLKKHLHSQKTLSLGCGTGRFMELADSGFDISSEMIAEAQRKFPGKYFAVGDASDTPFENQSYGQIFCLHVLMHLPVEKSMSILAESCRIMPKGGTLIVDFPSAKRRRMLRKKQENWHGASAYTMEELKKLVNKDWNLKTYSGILFLPIHRMPKWSRKFFLKLDYRLCNSFLREYASYLIVKLEKK